MAGEPGEGEQRFLPPEPSGPEPDLGREHPAQAGQQPPPAQAAPAEAWQQPPPAQAPPAGAWQQPPPAWQQPPPGYRYGPPQYGSQQPPPGWQRQAPWEQPPSWQAGPTAPQQPWAWQPQPVVPDNGTAVAGFVLSVSAAGLLVLSAGLSSVVSIVCAALGIVYSRRGRARVDRGETPKHRGLAQAGYVVGIISLVLAVLATIGWIVAFASGDFLDELEKELDEQDGTQTSLGRAAVALHAGTIVLRVAAALLR
jgi:hypothetical protein